MDKLNPTIQPTTLTTKSAESVSAWYETETTSGAFSPSEVGWLHAAGWVTTSYVETNGNGLYAMARRRIKPETVLQSLVNSYTTAYNEGRSLNDQRYDDLVTIFLAVLDATEDSFNLLETDDQAFEDAVDVLIASIATDHAAWETDTESRLDSWGTDRLAEINAAFDARLAAAKQELTDRGVYSTFAYTTASNGVERERQRALNEANDLITQRQLEQDNRIYEANVRATQQTIAAKDRLRVYLSSAKDRQVAVRNQAVEALGRLVEGRTDSYPGTAEIGRLAAALGAGSAESYSP